MSETARTTSSAESATRRRARTGKSTRARGRQLVDVVRKAVDEGATTVEDIHKAVADLPLEMIARLDGFDDALKDVRRIQKESIGAIYDLVRRVNRDVTRLAGEVLEARRGRGRRSSRSHVRRSTAAQARA